MSDPKKKRPRKSRAKSPTLELVPPPATVEDPTITSLCEKASRVADGMAAEHGWRTIVIVYDPALRNYQCDWRGSPNDIAGMMLLRAGLRVMGTVG